MTSSQRRDGHSRRQRACICVCFFVYLSKWDKEGLIKSLDEENDLKEVLRQEGFIGAVSGEEAGHLTLLPSPKPASPTWRGSNSARDWVGSELPGGVWAARLGRCSAPGVQSKHAELQAGDGAWL